MRETGVSGRPWRAVAIAVVALIAAAALSVASSDRPDTARHAVSAPVAPLRSNVAVRDHAPVSAVHASVASGAGELGPAQAEAHEPGTHPHPISAAHQRIFRENNLIGALNLAVDLEDAIELRELLAQYRAEYPEDEHRLQVGYALIAECLERLDAATPGSAPALRGGASLRERAQRFWDTEIRSQTRRYVRRYCLERELAS
jgi:hypothetical protein